MNLDNLSFKSACPTDADILIGFMRDLYQQDDIPFDAAIAHAALLNLIENPDWGEVWLIQKGDRPIGYTVLTLGYSLEFTGRDAFIDELYVIPTERGQGIGTVALNFLRDRCLVHQVKALHLEVERENSKAQKFYQRAGFTHHDHLLMTTWIRPDQS